MLQRISIRLLLGILFVTISVAAIALRDNYSRMVELRSAVYAADKAGEGVEEALDELRTHVYGHMNTNLNSGGVSIKPPIQLKYTYERLTGSQNADIESHNKQVLAEAPGICESRFGAGRIKERAACVDEYIASNTKQLNDNTTIPKELYQFDFASPAWSPDVAGFSIVAAVLVGMCLIARILLGWYYKHEL